MAVDSNATYYSKHVSKGFFVTPRSLRRGTRAVYKRGAILTAVPKQGEMQLEKNNCK